MNNKRSLMLLMVYFLLIVGFLVFIPCAAFAIDSLTIDGSTYTSTDLAGDPTGTGWFWTSSANDGEGELTLNGYNGGAIESTNGVLNIHLIGDNIITTDETTMLSIHGSDTGLNIYGSDAATDTLTTRSVAVISSLYPILYGILVTISNSATIPISFSDFSYVLDVSQATSTEWVTGYNYPFYIYGIYVIQTVRNSSILGIDMQMDNVIINMSNESDDGSFSYGMWANSYYSSIEAVFNDCTFNISDFLYRGWYTGRDLAASSSATYNDCLFNMHTSSTGAIGVHVSCDNESFGVSTLILNDPSGEIETSGLAAVYSRGFTPTLTINGSTMQAWEADGTEIADPKIITVYLDSSYTSINSKTVGVADCVYMDEIFEQKAGHIIFTVLPTPSPTPEPVSIETPQTGDTAAPILYGVLLLIAAAGFILIRKQIAHVLASQSFSNKQ